ncbi:MAG: hypothetical protein K2Z81_26585 [Cyanobacteria bacterium]|nr:hypothetical protein [Cyanobacteriota bacterium]
MTVPLAIVALICVAILFFGAKAIEKTSEGNRKKIFFTLYALVSIALMTGSTAIAAIAVLHANTAQICLEACPNCYKALALMWIGPVLSGLLFFWAYRSAKPLTLISYILSALLVGLLAMTNVFSEQRMEKTRDYYLQHALPQQKLQK